MFFSWKNKLSFSLYRGMGLIILLNIICIIPLTAQTGNLRQYTVNYTANPPQQDGNIQPGEYKDAAPPQGDFRLSLSGAPAPDQNYFQAMWDDENLYIAFYTTDDNLPSQAGFPGDDAVNTFPGFSFEGDYEDVEFFFDPGDISDNISNENAGDCYQIAVQLTPGVRPAGVYREPYLFTAARYNSLFRGMSWNPKDIAVGVSLSGGVMVEIAIPFSNLNQNYGAIFNASTSENDMELTGPPSPGDRWAFQVARIDSEGPDSLWNYQQREAVAQHPYGIITFAKKPTSSIQQPSQPSYPSRSDSPFSKSSSESQTSSDSPFASQQDSPIAAPQKSAASSSSPFSGNTQKTVSSSNSSPFQQGSSQQKSSPFSSSASQSASKPPLSGSSSTSDSPFSTSRSGATSPSPARSSSNTSSPFDSAPPKASSDASDSPFSKTQNQPSDSSSPFGSSASSTQTGQSPFGQTQTSPQSSQSPANASPFGSQPQTSSDASDTPFSTTQNQPGQSGSPFSSSASSSQAGKSPFGQTQSSPQGEQNQANATPFGSQSGTSSGASPFSSSASSSTPGDSQPPAATSSGASPFGSSGSTPAQTRQGQDYYTSLEEGKQAMRNQGKRGFILIYNPMNEDNQRVEQILKLPQFQRELSDMVKVKIDVRDNISILSHYGFYKTPSVVMYDSKGKMQKKIHSISDMEYLLREIRKIK